MNCHDMHRILNVSYHEDEHDDVVSEVDQEAGPEKISIINEQQLIKSSSVVLRGHMKPPNDKSAGRWNRRNRVTQGNHDGPIQNIVPMKVTIQCYGGLSGECIGKHFMIPMDASIGRLMSKIRLVADADAKWFTKREFTIGEGRFSFDDQFMEFISTKTIKNELGPCTLDGGEVPCYIVRLPELEITKKMLTNWHFNVQPDPNAIRRKHRCTFEKSRGKNRAEESSNVQKLDSNQPSALIVHCVNCGCPMRGDEIDMRFDCGHYKCSECIPSCFRCQGKIFATSHESTKPTTDETKVSETNPLIVMKGPDAPRPFAIQVERFNHEYSMPASSQCCNELVRSDQTLSDNKVDRGSCDQLAQEIAGFSLRSHPPRALSHENSKSNDWTPSPPSSEAGSLDTQKGSDSEMPAKVAMQCYEGLSGKHIGEHFMISTDASVGHLISKIKVAASVDTKWFMDKEFTIGRSASECRLFFDEQYTRFTSIKAVKNEIRSCVFNNEKISCYIIRLSEIEITKRMLAKKDLRVQPGLHAFRRSRRKTRDVASAEYDRTMLALPGYEPPEFQEWAADLPP